MRLTGMIAALAALALAGCGLLGGSEPAAEPPPATVELNIVASPLLNPDLTNRASPVLVRVYELASPSVFEASDFFQLYEQDAATLAADLVAREDQIIAPGGILTLTRELAPQTRFIGVMVAFRDYQNAVWRAVVPVTPNATTPIQVELQSLGVKLSVPPPEVQPMEEPAEEPASADEAEPAA